MTLRLKFVVGFLLVSAILFGATYALMQWSFERGLLEYVARQEIERQQPLENRLVEFYQQHGDWTLLAQEPLRWRRLLRSAAASIEPRPLDKDFRPEGPPPGGFNAGPFGRRDEPPPEGHPPRPPTLLAADLTPVIGEYRDDFIRSPLRLDNHIIGWLAVPPRNHLTETLDLAFKHHQSLAFLLVSGLMVLVSLMISLPLAHRFVSPVRRLAAATHALRNGALNTRIDVSGRDELSQLADDFNQLAQTLEHNDIQRKQWIADISHELRTPLTIIKGELEAMLEQVRPMTAENLGSVHDEVIHLQKLIHDLFELSKAEIGTLSYMFSDTRLDELVAHTARRYQGPLSSHGLTLTWQQSPIGEAIWIHADETRLSQVLDNLMTNEIHHVPPGNQVRITLSRKIQDVELVIEDSGRGVRDSDLARLFDHLYRTDASRSRDTGGAGIGLAMCRKIVEAHGGTIAASHSELGGLAITLRLPQGSGMTDPFGHQQEARS